MKYCYDLSGRKKARDAHTEVCPNLPWPRVANPAEDSRDGGNGLSQSGNLTCSSNHGRAFDHMSAIGQCNLEGERLIPLHGNLNLFGYGPLIRVC